MCGCIALPPTYERTASEKGHKGQSWEQQEREVGREAGDPTPVGMPPPRVRPVQPRFLFSPVAAEKRAGKRKGLPCPGMLQTPPASSPRGRSSGETPEAPRSHADSRLFPASLLLEGGPPPRLSRPPIDHIHPDLPWGLLQPGAGRTKPHCDLLRDHSFLKRQNAGSARSVCPEVGPHEGGCGLARKLTRPPACDRLTGLCAHGPAATFQRSHPRWSPDAAGSLLPSTGAQGFQQGHSNTKSK